MEGSHAEHQPACGVPPNLTLNSAAAGNYGQHHRHPETNVRAAHAQDAADAHQAQPQGHLDSSMNSCHCHRAGDFPRAMQTKGHASLAVQLYTLGTFTRYKSATNSPQSSWGAQRITEPAPWEPAWLTVTLPRCRASHMTICGGFGKWACSQQPPPRGSSHEMPAKLKPQLMQLRQDTVHEQ